MDCLVDIDKLIDDLEDNETNKSSFNNHKSEKNGKFRFSSKIIFSNGIVLI